MASFKEKLNQGRFVITAELDPPRGADPSGVLRQAQALLDWVDAVNVADCPMAGLRMSPIAVAALVQEELKLEAVFHLTCRDRNLLGLQAELLGAWALGVHNILALTGDDPGRGDHPGATGVFDVSSAGLVRIAASLNQGQSVAGRRLDGTDFLIGVVANPATTDQGAEIARLEEKVAAGAHFVQTQPVFDLRVAEVFARAVEHLAVPVLFGLLPLTGPAMARNITARVPGIVVPPSVIERLERDPDSGPAIARAFLTEVASFAAGVHFFPMGHPERVVAVCRAMDDVAPVG